MGSSKTAYVLNTYYAMFGHYDQWPTCGKAVSRLLWYAYQ